MCEDDVVEKNCVGNVVCVCVCEWIFLKTYENKQRERMNAEKKEIWSSVWFLLRDDCCWWCDTIKTNKNTIYR